MLLSLLLVLSAGNLGNFPGISGELPGNFFWNFLRELGFKWGFRGKAYLKNGQT
jgi:hypothetical protein